MNARNELRRETIRAVVETAETETKSENPNINESKHINSTTKIEVCHPTCQICCFCNFLFFF
jgi:hypothetical protein